MATDLADAYPRYDLTGQRALVSVASRGLGRAISLALANAGADVALGLRDVNSAPDLADAIRSMGRRALPVQMDVRYRETAGGGLAATPTGRRLAKERLYQIKRSDG